MAHSYSGLPELSPALLLGVEKPRSFGLQCEGKSSVNTGLIQTQP